MNARIDLPSDDNVVNLLDFLDSPRVEATPERQTVARLHTVPRAAYEPVRRVAQPVLSPVALAVRAARFGTLAAAIGAAGTLSHALASGTVSAQQTPWLVAFVALMAFSVGATLGSASSFVAQRSVALARRAFDRAGA